MPPLLIDIPQMIDLALGTPEIGVVNFNVLHNLLHAIVEILNLDKYRVEFRGDHGIKIEKLIQHIPADPIVMIQEFKVELANEKEQKVDKRIPVPKHRDDRYDKILVIRKTDEMEEDSTSRATRSRPPIQQPVQIVSQDDFKKLASRGGSIHDPIGRYLPNNQDVFDSARGESEDSRNPVGEMWYILNVTKRVDATEVAIEKITSMMRDISEEYHKLKNSMERYTTMADVSHLVDKIDFLEKNFHDQFGKQPSRLSQRADRKSVELPSTASGGGTEAGSAPWIGGQASTAALPKHGGVGPLAKHAHVHPGTLLTHVTGGHSSDSMEQQYTQNRKSGGGFESSGIERPHHRDSENSEHFTANHHSNIEDILDEYYDLKMEVERIKNIVYPGTVSDIQAAGQTGPALTGPSQLIPGTGAKGDQRDLFRRMELLESKLNTVEHQIYDVENDLAELTDRFEDDGRPSTAIKADANSITDIHAKITAMRTDLDNTIDRCNFLNVDRDQIIANIDSMNKKMEEFKNGKVDRVEIDELLADKVDYNMLHYKVSVDQFNATKRHLTKGLVEALERLTEQGKSWEQAVDEVRSMTLNKVGREELTPLREYIDSKINALQDRLKALAALRRDPEAAGTKSRYLRKVNCISCDHDVIMRLDEPVVVPRSEAIPEPRTLKPFLVYELDSIRKQMKDPYGRNLHHFETMTTNKQRAIVNERPKTLANRYCGGSHTIHTPQDRIQRCKFNKNLMPAECFVKTDEGCYYKAIKKECTCPGEQPHLLKEPDDKQSASARSSKSGLKSAAEVDQADTIAVVKQPASVHSSRSDIKSDRGQEKTLKDFKQTAIDTLPTREDASHSAFIESTKDQIHARDSNQVMEKIFVAASKGGETRVKEILSPGEDEPVDALECVEDYGSGLIIGEEIGDELFDDHKVHQEYEQENEDGKLEIV